MSQLDQQKEWDFICSETSQLHQSKKSNLTRELLFVAQNLLTLHSEVEDITRKSFLASIYLKTKDSTSNRLNNGVLPKTSQQRFTLYRPN